MESYYYLYIWVLSIIEIVLIVYIVIGDFCCMEEVKCEVKYELEYVGIIYVILEFEYKGVCCEGEDCIF